MSEPKISGFTVYTATGVSKNIYPGRSFKKVWFQWPNIVFACGWTAIWFWKYPCSCGLSNSVLLYWWRNSIQR